MKEIKELYVSKDYIINILQRYKPSLQKIMERPIHLDWKQNKIQIEGVTPGAIGELSGRGKPKDFNSMIKNGYSKDLVNAIVVYSLVEDWMKILTDKEKEILFYKYIDHDFEKQKISKLYKCLSFDEISKKVNISRKNCFKHEQKALKKIEIYIN